MEYKGLQINWLGHAGFQIKSQITIYIDPFKIKISESADAILITHEHFDHCSLEDIQKIIKPDTVVFGPADIQSKLAKISREIKFQVILPGDAVAFKDIKIRAYPAYNINKQFHPKGNHWLGYLIDINGVRIYHAGDSDAIPEMKELKNLDLFMVPIGGTYTMNIKESAQLCNSIMPKIAIPMHYGSVIGTNDDALNFKKLCKCSVQILDLNNFL